VAAGFEGRVAEEFAGGGVDDAGLKVLDEQDDTGSVVETVVAIASVFNSLRMASCPHRRSFRLRFVIGRSV